tara:strand:- start:715 stop:1083 length:369 start_codon:yes stop_codon:yes gene_type:complete
MINMYDAFSGDTTTPVQYFKKLDGYYDGDNHWVDEGFEEPTIINVTPMPFGDRDAGIAGIELKAKTTGERIPAFMKFTGVYELQINDRITIYGLTYKLIKRMRHTSAGFNIMIGATIPEDSR